MCVCVYTCSGYEQAETYPRNLGDALKEGDVVTMWLDLDTGTHTHTNIKFYRKTDRY